MAVSLAKKRRLEKLEAKRCTYSATTTSHARPKVGVSGGDKAEVVTTVATTTQKDAKTGQLGVSSTSMRMSHDKSYCSKDGGEVVDMKRKKKKKEESCSIDVQEEKEDDGGVYDKAVSGRLCPWLVDTIDASTGNNNNNETKNQKGAGAVVSQMDGFSLGDVFHELLSTNPRYRSSTVSSIVDKMKDKTLLLDNPDSKRDSRSKGRYLKHSGVAKLSRKELAGVGALNVPGMGLTYDDALVLHMLWKEYRDGLLEDTRSKGDMEERVYGMDRHGAYIVVAERGVQGIVVADTQASMHIIDRNDRYRILPKKGLEYHMEVSKGTMVTILAQK